MTSEPGRVEGVECLSAAAGGFGLFAGADVAVVLNDPDPEVALALKGVLGPKGRVVLWTQHDVDQPAMAAFADVGVRRLWERVVFVSDWQRRRYGEAFGPEPGSVVIGNAMAPAFEGLFGDGEDVLGLKAPVLVYTPTPFRGLEVLLEAFPLIRARLPEMRLVVHSSLGVYQVAEDEDAHRDLYRRCRALPGVEYRGQVAQPELARSLRSALCFAYPSTFAETFCTSAFEAMAAGCLAVVGDLGALAETTRGLAELVGVEADRRLYAERFAERVVRALAAPEGLAERLGRQRRLLLATGTWDVRARAWGGFLEALSA
jgi:glycosyltransferase involved in cell wall biosynthesis